MTKKIPTMPPQLGCKPDPINRRDFRYEDFIAGTSKPADMPSFEKGYDVEETIGKLKDDHQDSSKRCVAQGGTNDLEMTILAETKKYISLSIRDAYSQIYLPGGGAYVRSFYKLAHSKGICEEKYCPSYPEDGSRVTEEFSRQRGEITPQREKNAEKWRIGNYRSITSLNLEVMARAIYENNGCGGGYKLVNSSMGHFVFFRGYGIHKGYYGLKFRDSYNPFEKWIIKHNGKFYYASTNNPLAFQIDLFSVWTVDPGNWQEKTMSEQKLNQIYNELLFRNWNKESDGSTYLNYDEDFVRNEVGKSAERWQLINGVNWLRKWKVINFFNTKGK